MRTRADIERLGYTVHATTKLPDGLSFDARFGSRFMVHGPARPSHEEAMNALFIECVNKAKLKGLHPERLIDLN